MHSNEILDNYTFVNIDSVSKAAEIIKNMPSKISVLAFDTESNTKIDMTKSDGSTIDLVNDMPILLQFGYDNTIYIADLTVSKELTYAVFEVFDKFCRISSLVVAHNIKFDINMLWNAGYVFSTNNACDSMSIARLALEAKTEREGGYPMGLKPLASRLLGSAYALLGKQLDGELSRLWGDKLRQLRDLLKPHGVSRLQIDQTLKDVTGSLEEYSLEVQTIWVNWIINAKISYGDINRKLLISYAGMDVIIVLELVRLLLPKVADKKLIDVLKLEMRLIMPLVRMERTGYVVDKKYLIHSKQALIFEINSIKTINDKILGVSLTPNQHAEIKKAIKLKYNYELENTDKKSLHIKILTDTSMPKPVKEYLENVMYLRTLEKFISTYINSMLYRLNNSKDNKVYTQFNSSGAVSGRFTSNFQQFPKEAVHSKLADFELFHPRKMFIVESEEYPVLAYIDYSQIELRLQAEYTYKCTNGTGDVNMLRAYIPFKCLNKNGKYYYEEDSTKEWSPVDVHTQTTAMAFPDIDQSSDYFKKLRKVGKQVNFAIIYGASLKKVQETLADTDPEVVKRLYYGFNQAFKDINAYRMWIKKEYGYNGYAENLKGRKYYIEESRDAYKLNNYVIQGSAADILKEVICKIDDYLQNKKSKLQACIHDELCFVIHKDEQNIIPEIQKIMETTYQGVVPLTTEASISTTSWGDKHD